MAQPLSAGIAAVLTVCLCIFCSFQLFCVSLRTPAKHHYLILQSLSFFPALLSYLSFPLPTLPPPSPDPTLSHPLSQDYFHHCISYRANLCFFQVCFLFVCLSQGYPRAHYASQASLKLTAVLLHQPPKCWVRSMSHPTRLQFALIPLLSSHPDLSCV